MDILENDGYPLQVELTECADVSVAELHLPCHPESAHRTEPNPASSNSLAVDTFERQLDTAGQVIHCCKSKSLSNAAVLRVSFQVGAKVAGEYRC